MQYPKWQLYVGAILSVVAILGLVASLIFSEPVPVRRRMSAKDIMNIIKILEGHAP